MDDPPVPVGGRKGIRTETIMEFFTIRALLSVLRRKSRAVLLAALLAGGALCACTGLISPPPYRAEALLYAGSDPAGVTPGAVEIDDFEISRYLAENAAALLHTRPVLEAVAERAEVSLSAEELDAMLSTEVMPNRQLLRVIVSGRSAEETERIAHAAADVLPQDAQEFSGGRFRFASLTVTGRDRIADHAMSFAGGVLFGAVLYAAVILLSYVSRPAFHTPDRLARAYPDLPVLAALPENALAPPLPNTQRNMTPEAAVSLNFLADALADADTVLGVSGEACALSALNTAYALAATGENVVLLEAGSLSPALRRYMPHADGAGLADFLRRDTDTRDVIRSLQLTPFAADPVALDVIPCGNGSIPGGDPAASRSMDTLLASLRLLYDRIIVALPAKAEGLPVTDALLFSVHGEKTKPDRLLYALSEAPAPVSGFLFLYADP